MHRPMLSACLLLMLGATAPAAEPLRFHYPEGGVPPLLYLAPGGERPTGVIATLVETAAAATGRRVHYEFQPRESASASLQAGSADGALFFSVTRPPAATLHLSAPVLDSNTVLVTLRDRPLGYDRPLDLRDQRLCTLVDDVYPPLALLSMTGHLLQSRAKTEQAQLMMLRDDRCVAAVMQERTFRWLDRRYGGGDLQQEKYPLLAEQVLLGFRPGEQAFASAVNVALKKLRASGELERQVDRHLVLGSH